MARVLLLMTTQTYKAEAFLAAAARLGLEAVVGTDRAQTLSRLNPAGNLTLPFANLDEAVHEALEYAQRYAIDAVLGADDDGVELAAALGQELGLPHNPLGAVRRATDKLATRLALHAAGLPTPPFWSARFAQSPMELAANVEFPCVLKPRHLSASRGVMRADDAAGLVRAHARLRAILGERGPADVAPARVRERAAQPARPEGEHRGSQRPERVRPDHDLLIEAFIPGKEVALEGLLTHGVFRPLALFDKPDPLDGPYFEETIYVTPSRHPEPWQHEAVETTRRALAALGLVHGPVHAELRLNDEGAWLLEASPRSIGGLCSHALRFGEAGISLEQVLLRNALGKDTASTQREASAAGVMMIPIPRAGILKAVGAVEAARSVPGVVDIRVTVPPGQAVAPPPEGDRYLGFIFARCATPADVEESLRTAHAALHIEIG